jgi:hypothetical protein
MDIKTSLPVNPEEEELAKKRQELAGLESELAESELRTAGMRVELAVFERRYLRMVGTRYVELDEIDAQISEILARNRPSDQQARDSAEQARTRANDSQAAAHEQSFGEQKEFSPSPSLKALYRQVAKRIHPDLTSDPAERIRRQKLMAEANLAYERSDEVGLRKILEDYERSPEVVQGEGTGAELVRAIRKIAQIKSRIREIKAEIEQVIQSDLYKLKVKVEEAEKQGRNLLKEMAEMVEGRIAEARERLQQVSRSNEARRH